MGAGVMRKIRQSILGKNRVDNIALGADGEANHRLALLRQQDSHGTLSENTEFMPGFFLNADPALALRGQYRSPKDHLLEFSAQTDAAARGWVGLHLNWPLHSLRDLGVIGFAARGHAAEMTLMRICLRSGTEEGFTDCFFDKHILLRPEEASHVDALSWRQRDEIPEQALWRELVLFLPSHGFELALTDLRVFAV